MQFTKTTFEQRSGRGVLPPPPYICGGSTPMPNSLISVGFAKNMQTFHCAITLISCITVKHYVTTPTCANHFWCQEGVWPKLLQCL